MGSAATKPLGEIAVVEMGQSPPSQFVSEEMGKGVPFLQGNAQFSELHPQPCHSCSKPGKIASLGDTLVSVRAPVGDVNRADREYCIGRGLAAIRFLKADPDFGYYALDHASSELARIAQGTTFDAVGGAELRQLAIVSPPLPEQRRTAEILDTLDATIRKTEELIAKLRQAKQGLLHDLLTRGLDENGELRDPERHPEQFKDSELGRIPRGWEVRRLEQWVRPDAPITYGIVQAGPHVPTGIPYIRTGDMKGEKLSPDGLLRTSPGIARSYRRSRVECGELVFAIRATVGKVLLVPEGLNGANLTQGTARVAPSSELNARFLLAALRHERTRQQIRRVQKGTTFQEITLGQLRSLEVAAPKNLGEQRTIAARLDELDRRIDNEVVTCEKFLTLKTGLMDDLLTGRVRVPMPEAST